MKFSFSTNLYQLNAHLIFALKAHEICLLKYLRDNGACAQLKKEQHLLMARACTCNAHGRVTATHASTC